MTGAAVNPDDIRAGADRIAAQVVPTPTVRRADLPQLHCSDVYLKLETLQRTGSFKDPGALTVEIVRRHVDEVVQRDEPSLEQAGFETRRLSNSARLE